jgi:hypothetical protein
MPLRARLLLTAVLTTTLAGCDAVGEPVDPVTADVTANAEAAPPPVPPVLSVTDLGVVAQLPIIRGRDGAISALVNGRSVWTFGDTPLDGFTVDGERWVDNSLSWTADLDASGGIAFEGNLTDAVGAPAEFIPYLDWERRYNERHDDDDCQAEPCGAEFAFWPGDIIPDPARDRALIFYYELWRAPTIEGWRTVGSGIAVWDGGRRVERPILDPGSPTPTLMWGRNEVAYTNAALVEGETLYAYGCKLVWIEHRCRVARVPLADVLDKAAWRYYTGSGWSPDPDRAKNLFVGGAAGTSVFYVPYLDGYMAIYSAIFSDDVVYRVARTPWGPWSEPHHLFTGRPGWNGTFNYTGHAHPEFAEADGRVQYVTYAHTTGFLQQDIPLVRVEFGKPAR